MNFKRYHVSKNLFASEWEQGSIDATTGENIPSTSTIRTKDYIPVSYDAIYSIKRSLVGGAINVRFYTQNKNYIGAGSDERIRIITGASSSNPMNLTQNFCCFQIIDSNIAYIRFNDFTNNLSNQYMMVEGEYTSQTIPDFEPYSSEVWHGINNHIRNTSVWNTADDYKRSSGAWS